MKARTIIPHLFLEAAPPLIQIANMTDPNFFIESDRLYLCYFQPDDDSHCDFLVRLYNTAEFIASIGGNPTSITTREAARALLAGRFRAEHARNGYGTYLILLKSRENDISKDESVLPFPARAARSTPVGTVSLMRGEPPNAYAAPDLGFAVLPEYCRRGIATEASRALLEFVKREKDTSDVLGLFNPENIPSRGVFRRLGFEDRGERVLEVFGGITGAVYTLPGMSGDLSVYGLPDEKAVA